MYVVCSKINDTLGSQIGQVGQIDLFGSTVCIWMILKGPRINYLLDRTQYDCLVAQKSLWLHP